ncbi:MAG TPA: gamma-glutamyltransferase [Terriglobia bacterium]|nr:gamma-glutamyltransferase [Terriglobia bacterium]
MQFKRLLLLLAFAFLSAGLNDSLAQQRYERVIVDSVDSRQTMHPVIRGAQYAVASMASQASMAAERILRNGGNAFDAIVAGQAVLGLVDGANNSIGSDAVLLIYDARAKKVWSLNAEGTAPKLATIDWYKKNQDGKIPVDDTLLSATVPGVIDAWTIMLSRWGTKTFAEVLAPAIDLAERGYPLSENYARLMGSERLLKYPSSARVYAPGGKKWKAGDIFANPDLARTLRRLVEAEKKEAVNGREAGLRAARDRFYKGDIAREMAEFSERNGGLFRYEDFASYTAKVEEPISINYRGYEVYKNPSAGQGPAELFALNLLEGYNLKAMGHNSVDYIHTSVEAMKLAMADRDKYLGDMDFIRIPYEGLLSKRYAEDRRKLISPEKASLEFRPGVAEQYMTGFDVLDRPLDVTMAGGANHQGDTSYIAVVDQQRNAISFTPSLHSTFGSKMVLGNLGFILNCRGDYYSLVPGHANALEPGKRPRSTLQSTLVMKDNKLFLVTGSPGGDDQCMRTMQTLLNIVEFGMDVQQAIEAPRWSTRSFPSSPFPHTMYPGELSVEDRISQSVRADLVRRGHRLIVNGPWTMGSSAAIMVDPVSGTLSAGADPRVSAQALAW